LSSGAILALCSAVAWAFWGICSKLSTNHGVPPTALAFFSACASFAIIFGTYAWQHFPAAKTAGGLGLAGLSGVCGAIGMLLFAAAIKRADATVVVTLSALYPVVTLLLGPVLLHEEVSLRHATGVVLVTLGVILVAR
jgi:transporter family protein